MSDDYIPYPPANEPRVYREKLVVVRAMWYRPALPGRAAQVAEWTGGGLVRGLVNGLLLEEPEFSRLRIRQAGLAEVVVDPGWWVIRSAAGIFSKCAPVEFDRIYEPNDQAGS